MDNGKYQHCKLSQVWKYRITFPLFKYFVNVMYLRQTLKGYYVKKELCCKETKGWSRFVYGVDAVYFDKIDSTVADSNNIIYHTHWGDADTVPVLVHLSIHLHVNHVLLAQGIHLQGAS